jgi:hypothetical protein
MSLREQMDAARAAGKLTKCYEEAANAPLIEFQATPHSRVIFPIAQLARAVWHDRSGEQPAPEGAPQHWRLCFATADVVITGWCLDKLVTLLRDHKLAAVRSIPGRPDFPKTEPFIAAIETFANDEPKPEPPPSEDGGNNAPASLPPDRPLVGRPLATATLCAR